MNQPVVIVDQQVQIVPPAERVQPAQKLRDRAGELGAEWTVHPGVPAQRAEPGEVGGGEVISRKSRGLSRCPFAAGMVGSVSHQL